MPRSRALLIALALAVCLIAGSPPRLVGDGGEYLAMALNFASLGGPALAPRDINRIQQEVQKADPSLESWDVRQATVAGKNGSRDFLHFWFYPLLTAPAVWVTQALGATPIAAFAVLNLCLLGIALWIAWPRLGAATCLLLFAGPVVWWIDKPHTEAFTFALLTVAFLVIEGRPWWSMVAAGAAATQNPPIALVVVLILAAHVILRRDMFRDRRFQLGAAVGVGLAALPPVYTYLRHGTPSLLLAANPARTPTFAELIAVPFDPNVGLLANFPIFVLVVALAEILLFSKRTRGLFSIDNLIAGVTTAGFLVSFAQAPNVHHGATPGMSRYAIWLIPLAIPVLRGAERLGSVMWRRFSWSAATVSAVVCVFVFHPGVPQYTRQPTLLADYLWTQHPGWNNPLPEVFAETLVGLERRWVPVATANCEKVLLTGRSDGGAWPVPCFPAPLPAECATAGTLCYANRRGTHYEFTRAPGSPIQLEGFVYQPDWVWPAATESHVRSLFTQWDWGTLAPRVGGDNVLRAAHDVHVLELQGTSRYVFVLRQPGPDASITMRLPRKMSGALVDATTGEVVGHVQFDGQPFESWEVRPPTGHALLLLALLPS